MQLLKGVYGKEVFTSLQEKRDLQCSVFTTPSLDKGVRGVTGLVAEIIEAWPNTRAKVRTSRGTWWGRRVSRRRRVWARFHRPSIPAVTSSVTKLVISTCPRRPPLLLLSGGGSFSPRSRSTHSHIPVVIHIVVAESCHFLLVSPRSAWRILEPDLTPQTTTHYFFREILSSYAVFFTLWCPRRSAFTFFSSSVHHEFMIHDE